MRDISSELHWIMLEHHCSPMQALCILSNEVSQNGICNVQPKSDKKTCGRLCNPCSCKDNEQVVGGHVS